jgi:hypothetical protein
VPLATVCLHLSGVRLISAGFRLSLICGTAFSKRSTLDRESCNEFKLAREVHLRGECRLEGVEPVRVIGSAGH